MKLKRTSRGFAYLEFKDSYGQRCSLQQSSTAIEACIWLGSDDPPRFDAVSQTAIGNRMHLTRKQVKKLLPYLHRFVETGDLD